MPVRPLLVGNSPALAAAELGPTDCTRAPEDTLRALATWSVDNCRAQQVCHTYTHAHTRTYSAPQHAAGAFAVFLVLCYNSGAHFIYPSVGALSCCHCAHGCVND